MEDLYKLIGSEFGIRKASRMLNEYARAQRPGVVGAMHITCSDESELECTRAFERAFASDLLPELEFGERSVFRIANLGGRYDWGAVHIAEEHYRSPAGKLDFKLMVVKVNSHTGVINENGSDRFGILKRYGTDSSCCGALVALMKGAHSPALDQLREAFGSEGKDRIAILMDGKKVAPQYRNLYTAIVSARLQARQVMLDIQDHTPEEPVLYLVLPCVTINRAGQDSEILCGIYTADYRTAVHREEYIGLGDDPSNYSFSIQRRGIHIEDKTAKKPRPARNHRRLVLEQWRKHHPNSVPRNLQKLREHLQHALKDKYKPKLAQKALLSLLPVLAETIPVTAAVFLFVGGAADISHYQRAHRLARGMAREDEALHILKEMPYKITTLPPEKAGLILKMLENAYMANA